MMKIFPKKGILIAFGELFLKSEKVRRIFKRRLIKNLSLLLKKENISFQIFPFRERIFIETPGAKKVLTLAKEIFGISWLAEGLFFEEANLKEVSYYILENYKDWIKKNETFGIRLKKGREIKERGREIIEEITRGIKRNVDLEKPKREIFIEARRKGWFLYFKKNKGKGGLPVGTAGRVLSLISGGIDSPVAAYLITKRGAENIWLHFHSFPLVSQASIEKVRELAKVFLKYQFHLKIYFLPFQKAQIVIKTKVFPKYRVLFYRRIMFKIAEKIAKKEECQALVTGESLGQVSSQTLPNLQIIGEGIKIPILRPLIGQDKEEIIGLAKKIKTYQISIKPQEDCCSLFVPKQASASGNLKTIKNLEKKLNYKKIIQEVIKGSKIYKARF